MTQLGERSLKEVTDALRPFGEPDRCTMARVDKASSLDFLAIRVPILRGVVKRGFGFYSLPPNDILDTWDFIWNRSEFYEVMATPLFYYQLQGRRVAQDVFPVIRHWIDRVENWGHCDCLSSVYANLCHESVDKVFPFLLQLTSRPNQWARRSAVVSLVHYTGKNAVYLEPRKTFELLERVLGDESRYVAKGVGWVLRETARSDFEAVKKYVRRTHSAMSAVVAQQVVSELRKIDHDMRWMKGRRK